MNGRSFVLAVVLGLGFMGSGARSWAQGDGGGDNAPDSADTGSAGDEATRAISELERFILQASSAAAAHAELPRHEALYLQCRAGFSMPSLVNVASSGALRGEKILEIISQDVWRYTECKAYADGNFDACRAIKWFPFGTESRIDLCREFSRKLILAKSVIRGDPDAEKVCERLYLTKAMTDDAIKGGTMAETCQVIVNDKDPNSVCAKRSRLREPRPYSEDEMKECVFFQGARLGDRQYCDVLPKKKGFCLQFAAYKDVSKSGNPDLCGGGDAVICRLLMGEGARTCDGFVEKIETAYCRDRSIHEEIGGRGGLRRRVAEAAGLLAKWKGALAKSDHDGREKNEREARRLERLRERIETLTNL